jgi:hypothetical protein
MVRSRRSSVRPDQPSRPFSRTPVTVTKPMRPIVRCRAGFHADQTRLERPKIGDHAAPPPRQTHPSPSTPWTWNQCLARSKPMVVICMVDGSSHCGVHRRPHCGTSMPGAAAVHPIKTFGAAATRGSDGERARQCRAHSNGTCFCK